MTRTVPAAFATAILEPHIEAYHAVELFFDSGTVRIWTGVGTRTINSQTYIGASTIMKVSTVEETVDLSAKTAEIVLSGLDSTLIALAIGEPYQGRLAKLYVGISSISEVVELFSGVMNTMEIFDNGETATITLSIDSKLIELEKTPAQRYTQESQNTLYSGDTFFAYVASLIDSQITFGKSK
jgi:hypothetical protein